MGPGPFHGPPSEFEEGFLADVTHLGINGYEGSETFRGGRLENLFHVGMMHFQKKAEAFYLPIEVIGCSDFQLSLEIGDPFEPFEG